MANKNLSVLILSFIIYILGFLSLKTSNPALFEQENPNKCFMQFFTTGIFAVGIYWMVCQLCD